MKYYFTIFLFLTFSNIFSQDNFLNKVGLKKEEIQIFCDSAREENKFRTVSFPGYSNNIQLGKGEYFFANNDSCFLYEKPSYWDSKKIDKFKFSDSVYVFKDKNNLPISIYVAGYDIGGENYYLCTTKTGKLAWLKGDDFIPISKWSLSPNSDYYLTTNRLYNLLISKDKKYFFKIPTTRLIWSDDKNSFIYNDCLINCNSNSLIYKFNIKSRKPEVICKGLIPYAYQGNKTILYFKDTVINSTKKEFVFRVDLENKAKDMFYQIPDSLTYWSNGDDFVLPSSIVEVQMQKGNLYKILLFKKLSESNSHYYFYFDKDKQLIKFGKD